ncbi:MAG: Nuclear protein SET [Candidatus Nomurabacteria bacterium GW2011_GWF2_35_66]|uniref:Nuclear protein SET n=1 Tax=Candidatus Nomurabacteria bacterium GW2011_GWE1_35_16 TaxID=1618761 RepID=A0A0G0DU63_9BACT|nr:MAG: Nuclear protein SET [Candidatus Nomurabacteria bacterium GW2011_GWF1_34_20]KKP63363.1 MAG: Nuclear protein SET [Candidatus Nomurabacteria bacterium GW2011_GWE2_34_25]KKP66555.1 MAG: Nuclear protein SET [Candidatus Nomurabacteria bacterium GW2011_GWE1_35_16]KKP83601.1 MAG: Nuclear protein SET [Candidatus Nomurabacteria bacterium GW2011_GWF2_35_66]HAE36862.1 hypothetical protein [Candidatus Nomurabacteria bacterium]
MEIYKGESKLHGVGLFALKNIKKGKIVLVVKGERIKFLIDSDDQAKTAELNWFGFSKNTWIGVSNNLCDFINHSCNPNVGVKGQVTLVAIRDIKKDEEITLDYSLNEADIFWNMKCNCGEKNCRKIIKSIQFISKEKYKKYKKYIPQYFKNVFLNFNILNFKNIEELKIKWVDFLKSNF